jgi:hypothetical protein
MTDSEVDIVVNEPQQNPVLPLSPSFYRKIYNNIIKDPFSAISSICVLFILIILSLLLYKFF